MSHLWVRIYRKRILSSRLLYNGLLVLLNDVQNIFSAISIPPQWEYGCIHSHKKLRPTFSCLFAAVPPLLLIRLNEAISWESEREQSAHSATRISNYWHRNTSIATIFGRPRHGRPEKVVELRMSTLCGSRKFEHSSIDYKKQCLLGNIDLSWDRAPPSMHNQCSH